MLFRKLLILDAGNFETVFALYHLLETEPTFRVTQHLSWIPITTSKYAKILFFTKLVMFLESFINNKVTTYIIKSARSSFLTTIRHINNKQHIGENWNARSYSLEKNQQLLFYYQRSETRIECQLINISMIKNICIHIIIIYFYFLIKVAEIGR